MSLADETLKWIEGERAAARLAALEEAALAADRVAAQENARDAVDRGERDLNIISGRVDGARMSAAAIRALVPATENPSNPGKQNDQSS